MLSYFTLILYIAAAGGNPFLNFFMQSAIELPGFFFGSWMGKLFEIKYNKKFEIVFIAIFFFSTKANTIGRRWTNTISFFLSAVCCIPTFFLANCMYRFKSQNFSNKMVSSSFLSTNLRFWMGEHCHLFGNSCEILVVHNILCRQFAIDGNLPNMFATNRHGNNS